MQSARRGLGNFWKGRENGTGPVLGIQSRMSDGISIATSDVSACVVAQRKRWKCKSKRIGKKDARLL